MDVSDPSLFESGRYREAFRRLRAEDPVHFCEESPHGPYWSLTTYHDIDAVDRNHRVFSSALEHGGNVIVDYAPEASPSFIAMDPPEHRRHRSLVTPVFTTANLAGLEAEIRARARDILDRVPVGEPFDWVDRAANQLPSQMLSTLFGVPEEDRGQMFRWARHIMSRVEGAEAPAERGASFSAYFLKLLEERRRQPPRFDLISHLVHGPNARALSDETFLSHLKLLVVGANDTTRSTIAGSLKAMVDHPGSFAALQANPGLIAGATAELIRFVSPVVHQRRTALEDARVGGRTIYAGDKVILWIVSGNRDERVFPDADRLVLDRSGPRPLSFGSGVHHCIGFRLAQLQVRVLWEELIRRYSSIEVVGPVKRAGSSFVFEFLSMPVVVRH